MNIVGIGIDLAEIERVEKLYDKYPEQFLARRFTEHEQAYAARFANPSRRLAARFAGKEAVMKSLGRGWRQLRWKDIEIVRKREQAPVLCLHGDAHDAARALGAERVWLSLSHAGDLCVGQVILEAGP